MLQLQQIDLTKGQKSNHPDIKPGSQHYLAKIHDRWSVGTFGRVWFGLTFHDGHINPQFDTPGYNSSQWQELYKLVDLIDGTPEATTQSLVPPTGAEPYSVHPFPSSQRSATDV